MKAETRGRTRGEYLADITSSPSVPPRYPPVLCSTLATISKLRLAQAQPHRRRRATANTAPRRHLGARPPPRSARRRGDRKLRAHRAAWQQWQREPHARPHAAREGALPQPNVHAPLLAARHRLARVQRALVGGAVAVEIIPYQCAARPPGKANTPGGTGDFWRWLARAPGAMAGRGGAPSGPPCSLFYRRAVSPRAARRTPRRRRRRAWPHCQGECLTARTCGWKDSCSCGKAVRLGAITREGRAPGAQSRAMESATLGQASERRRCPSLANLLGRRRGAALRSRAGVSLSSSVSGGTGFSSGGVAARAATSKDTLAMPANPPASGSCK